MLEKLEWAVGLTKDKAETRGVGGRSREERRRRWWRLSGDLMGRGRCDAGTLGAARRAGGGRRGRRAVVGGRAAAIKHDHPMGRDYPFPSGASELRIRNNKCNST